ncbi:MAG: hypothetical protein ACOX2F_05880 [bacterium]
MLPCLPELEMPSWLENGDFTFSVEKVLKDSLFYPACGTDGDPVKYLLGNVYNFVYVDSGISEKHLKRELFRGGFRGYRIIHKEDISMSQLIPNGWRVRFLPDENYESHRPDAFSSWMVEPYCKWYIFEREEGFGDAHNPKRFSLLFLAGDGAASYQGMYLSNKIAPLAVAIIQPGHGFGGNWTNFEDRKAILARSVFHDPERLPKYLVFGGLGDKKYYRETPWAEFSKFICEKQRFHDGGWLTIWERNGN